MIEEIKEDIEKVFLQNADLSMVDSDRGITNLHVPSDVIIDASMPAMIRTSGQMWNKFNKVEDTKAIIPDSSYASIYSATIDFCKENGANFILRGIRNNGDFEFEKAIARTNRKLSKIETVFLLTSTKTSFISSSIVRELILNKGDFQLLVPDSVKIS